MTKFLPIVALIGIALADPIPIEQMETHVTADLITIEPPIEPPRVPSTHRIIGGEDTPIEEVPYQVSIIIQTRHYCGGTIIGEKWVLTAAHCATLPIGAYAVRAGSSKNQIGGSIHKLALILIYEGYYMDSYSIPINDIALFKVKTPFQMGSNRQAIDLYKRGEETIPGRCAVITGWGTTSPTSPVEPHILQSVRVPMISKAECQKAYANFTKLNPGQICAAYPGGGKDACQGDSGGPLVIDERLAGVVSWGYGCALAGRPGVYTEVAYFRDWIDKTMKRYNSASSFMASMGTITLTTIAHIG